MPAIAARLLLLALLLPFSLPAFALEDTPQNREQQAERYLEAVPPQSMMTDMSSKMAETLPEEQREMAKMGTYMSEVMPATMSEVQSALAKAQGEAHHGHPDQSGQDKGSQEN